MRYHGLRRPGGAADGVGPPGHVLRRTAPAPPRAWGPGRVVPGSTVLWDDTVAFHGAGGAVRPDLAVMHRGRGTGHFLQRTVHPEPGTSITVNAAFGYLPHGTGCTSGDTAVGGGAWPVSAAPPSRPWSGRWRGTAATCAPR